MSARGPRVAIVGAGVGGLSLAARLAHQGFEVDVFEKESGPGGRCNRLEVEGFHFDMGPTILLMPEVVERTFTAVGKRMADYLTLHRCDPNYRIHFRDGSDVTFTSELTQMGRELERIEPGSFPRYLRFLAQGQRQYQTSLKRFVGRNFDNLFQFITPANLRHIFAIKAHKRMYREVSRFFSDERLRAAMTFQTMYLGISPFESPAVYGLLPFSELGVGIWFPEGGLYALPLALERLGRELGVRFHYGAPVRRVTLDGARATGVELESGGAFPADHVVCNADLPYAYESLIDKEVTTLKRAEALKYTSSGYMLYLGLNRQVPELLHHNVFLGRDFRGSFDDLFKRFQVPADPSFYINIPNRTDPRMSPSGKDAAYVLVPVPHQHAGLDWAELGPRVRAQVFARLEDEGIHGLEAAIEVERVFTPDDWQSRFNCMHGSAFGLSHHFFQIGPFRPQNQDARVRNLFFVGASTQPGTGLPTVMLSAELTCERMLKQEALAPTRPQATVRAERVAA